MLVSIKIILSTQYNFFIFTYLNFKNDFNSKEREADRSVAWVKGTTIFLNPQHYTYVNTAPRRQGDANLPQIRQKYTKKQKLATGNGNSPYPTLTSLQPCVFSYIGCTQWGNIIFPVTKAVDKIQLPTDAQQMTHLVEVVFHRKDKRRQFVVITGQHRTFHSPGHVHTKHP